MVENTPQEYANNLSNASTASSFARQEADLNADLLSIDPGKLLVLLLASMTVEDKARTVDAARAQGLLRTRDCDTQTSLVAGPSAQPANRGPVPTVHPLFQAQKMIRQLQAAVTGQDPSRAQTQKPGTAVPNGQPGMPGGPMPGGPPMAPPHFANLGQQSQPNSPAAQSIAGQSPSMVNRQIRPPQDAMQSMQSMRQLQEAAVNADLLKIESAKLPALKAELGLADKDLPSLTLDDKQRILGLARARGFLPPAPRPQGGVSGQPHKPPSGMMPRQGMVPFATMPMSNPSAMNMPGGPAGTPHMSNAMLANQAPMVTPQMQQRVSPQYRQTMQALHKTGVAQAAGPGQGPMPFNSLMTVTNAASPATSSDSPYSNNPEQSRPGTGPFGMQGMPPNRMLPGQKMPPLPSPSAAGKNMGGPQGPGGPGDKPGEVGGMNQSPRNAASAPGQQGQPGQPATPGAGGANMLGPNPPPPPPQMQPQDMFSADLMGANFDTFGFDASMFEKSDGFNGLGDIGDMSEWFNDQGLMADKL